jgi:hypothetical protein
MFEEFSKFISHNYFLIVYGITWIISVVYYRKFFDTILKYFPILIAYTFFNELLGYMIGISDQYAFFSKYENANDLIYNIYTLIFFPFFYYSYWKMTQSKKRKNVIKYLSILTILVFAINTFLQNPLIMVFYYSIVFASIVLVICILIYWIDKKEDWVWSREKYNLMTWISIGLFVFHLFFPAIFLITFLDSAIWQEYYLGYVHKVLIIIMYSLFCIGFIISRRRAFR